MKEIDLSFIGHIAVDTNIDCSDRVESTLGGGGLSPAIAASTVLAPDRIGIISKIGDDEFGTRAKSYIDNKGCNTEGLEVIPGDQTTWVVIKEMAVGRRIAVDLGVSRDFIPSVPESHKFAKYAHIGSGPSVQQMYWFEKIRDKFSSETIISADPLEVFVRSHPQETKVLLERVGLIFINEEEWSLVSQYGELVTKSPIILKRGEKGAVYIFAGERISIPAPKVKVAHTTGAGDTLAGVFLGLRAQNVPIAKALEKAVEYASISITQFGIEHLAESMRKHQQK